MYDLSIIPALVLMLKTLLCGGANGSNTPRAYIASTIRNEDTRDAFLIAMGKLKSGILLNCKIQVDRDFFQLISYIPTKLVTLTSSHIFHRENSELLSCAFFLI